MLNLPGKYLSMIKNILQKLGINHFTLREAMAMYRAKLALKAKFDAKPGRVAIVGCGTMGTDIGLAVYNLPNWKVTALCDARAESAERMKKEIGSDAEVFTSLDDLLRNHEKFDILAIATWAPTHVDFGLRAIQAGVKNIFVEKPVGVSLADADSLMAAAVGTGTVVVVDHTRRCLPSTEGLRRLIDSGVIGKVRALHMMWGRGGIANIGTHLFDFARCLMKEDLVRIRGEFDEVVHPNPRGEQFVDPSGRFEGRFTNGARLTLDLSEDIPHKHFYVVILGDNGRIEVDERLGHLRLVGKGGRVWEDLFIGPDSISLGVETALLGFMTGKSVGCSLADGRAALEASIACHLSVRESGGWVNLPLAGDICKEEFPFA